MALVLAESDQEVVDDQPVLCRELGAQGEFGLLRRFGADVAPPVADPVDMGIDADPRFAEAEGDDQVCGLASHPLELEEFVKFVGNDPPVPVEEGAAYFAD